MKKSNPKKVIVDGVPYKIGETLSDGSVVIKPAKKWLHVEALKNEIEIRSRPEHSKLLDFCRICLLRKKKFPVATQITCLVRGGAKSYRCTVSIDGNEYTLSINARFLKDISSDQLPLLVIKPRPQLKQENVIH